ncbi:MAG TPA: hypothetical protein VGR26_08815 [Acidimicrobiales bacterium]|nr:hypothetical protein [Acidimicrobiales bacterium]
MAQRAAASPGRSPGGVEPVGHQGIALGTGNGANRNYCLVRKPALDAVAERGLLVDCETLCTSSGATTTVSRGTWSPVKRLPW